MPVEEEKKDIEYSDGLDKFIHFAFDDLVDVASSNYQLFEELYYNRKSQCDEFYALMEDSHVTSPNVLIVGGAGVGKTSFVHKLIISTKKDRHYCLMLDYRKVVPRTKDGLISYFIKEMEKYFDEVGHPINTLSDTNKLDSNFQCVYSHLDLLDKNDVSKHLILFLDDFDYAEEEWFELLSYFIPFSNNEKTSLVLSVREPLLNSIDEYDDRFRSSYIKKARQITLSPISVENVISTRLAPILIEKENTNKLYGILSGLFNRKSPLCVLARTHGTIVDDLPRFEYPLTKKHNTFMQRITSGDIRETFAIAYESLKFIFEHDEYVQVLSEDGLEKKRVGREGVMKMLYDNSDASYKIENIHKLRSKSGNSLFFNVLEAVKMLGVVDERFYRSLTELGHSKKRIDDAIESLSSKRYKFFVPSKIVPKKVKKNIEYNREYIPLPKLEMYLEMCTDWQEYISRCGHYGKSIEV
ncbi:MAG: ATP-binding protein [Gammaproteobacteria bacterium]|nr:ATP-binding protein [Gammaproteobacteria bacterium]